MAGPPRCADDRVLVCYVWLHTGMLADAKDGSPTIEFGVDEQWLSSGQPIEFTITLEGDTWVGDIGQEDFGLGATSALLEGIQH